MGTVRSAGSPVSTTTSENGSVMFVDLPVPVPSGEQIAVEVDLATRPGRSGYGILATSGGRTRLAGWYPAVPRIDAAAPNLRRSMAPVGDILVYHYTTGPASGTTSSAEALEIARKTVEVLSSRFGPVPVLARWQHRSPGDFSTLNRRVLEDGAKAIVR